MSGFDGSLGARDAHLWLAPPAPAPRGGSDQALLDPQERARAARFRFAADRHAFIGSHAVLRSVLARYLGCPAQALRFASDRHGKPWLPDHADWFFNLSHSAGWTLVGISRVGPIGVDLEAVRPVPDLLDIAERSFARSEARALAALPSVRRHDAFFACWTAKEAFLKASGVGLAGPLDGFEVGVDPDAPARLLAIDGDRDAALAWSLEGAVPGPDMRAAVAMPFADVSFLWRTWAA